VIRCRSSSAGRAPHDLSIVGFDGVKLDGIAPYDASPRWCNPRWRRTGGKPPVIALLGGEHPEAGLCPSPHVFISGTTTAPPSG
jgi:hypothetical protein